MSTPDPGPELDPEPSRVPVEFAAVAELFGRLLIRELDGPLLAALHDPELRPLLDEMDLRPPPAADDGQASTLDTLAAEFFARFLDPQKGHPLVQSLWESGSYEAECTTSLRHVAGAASMEFDASVARAPLDHLGSILLLWSAVREPRPELARWIEQHHLAWSHVPLEQIARSEGFYGRLAAAVRGLVAELEAGDEAD